MNLHEKLIGKTCPIDAMTGMLRTFDVDIETAVPSEWINGIIINGKYVLSYDAAKRIAEGVNEQD